MSKPGEERNREKEEEDVHQIGDATLGIPIDTGLGIPVISDPGEDQDPLAETADLGTTPPFGRGYGFSNNKQSRAHMRPGQPLANGTDLDATGVAERVIASVPPESYEVEELPGEVSVEHFAASVKAATTKAKPSPTPAYTVEVPVVTVETLPNDEPAPPPPTTFEHKDRKGEGKDKTLQAIDATIEIDVLLQNVEIYKMYGKESIHDERMLEEVERHIAEEKAGEQAEAQKPLPAKETEETPQTSSSNRFTSFFTGLFSRSYYEEPPTKGFGIGEEEDLEADPLEQDFERLADMDLQDPVKAQKRTAELLAVQVDSDFEKELDSRILAQRDHTPGSGNNFLPWTAVMALLVVIGILIAVRPPKAEIAMKKVETLNEKIATSRTAAANRASSDRKLINELSKKVSEAKAQSAKERHDLAIARKELAELKAAKSGDSSGENSQKTASLNAKISKLEKSAESWQSKAQEAETSLRSLMAENSAASRKLKERNGRIKALESKIETLRSKLESPQMAKSASEVKDLQQQLGTMSRELKLAKTAEAKAKTSLAEKIAELKTVTANLLQSQKLGKELAEDSTEAKRNLSTVTAQFVAAMKEMVANAKKIQDNLDKALAEIATLQSRPATIRQANTGEFQSLHNELVETQQSLQLANENLATAKSKIAELTEELKKTKSEQNPAKSIKLAQMLQEAQEQLTTTKSQLAETEAKLAQSQQNAISQKEEAQDRYQSENAAYQVQLLSRIEKLQQQLSASQAETKQLQQQLDSQPMPTEKAPVETHEQPTPFKFPENDGTFCARCRNIQ